MKVRFTLSIGYANAKHEEIVEFDDEATVGEVGREWEAWVWNYIDGGPEIIEDD